MQRYFLPPTTELNEYLQVFMLTHNYTKRLETLRGLTPDEFVCAQRQKNPAAFAADPIHLTMGQYI